MPRSSKKRKEEPPSSSSDSEQDEPLPEENIQIDLEARSPADTDQPAILHFLEQSFGNSTKKSILDLNQLSTQLANQTTFGSVFYQPLDSTEDETDDDDDESLVLGICSFLRLDQQQNKQLHNWFLDKCSENEQAKALLQHSKCGLFVNERYMNIPAEISLPAIRTLREEILFPVDYWIVHSKIRSQKNDSNFLNGEEEVFNDHAVVSIEYQPAHVKSGDWVEKRRILFVATNKLEKICGEIEQKLKQE